MKAICCLFLLLGAPLASAQDTLPPMDMDNPAYLGSKSACLAGCEVVYNDCRTECENRRARAHEPDDEGPDLPTSGCIDDCNAELTLCNEDC